MQQDNLVAVVIQVVCVRLAGFAIAVNLNCSSVPRRKWICSVADYPTAVHTWPRIGLTDASPTEVTQPGVVVWGGLTTTRDPD